MTTENREGVEVGYSIASRVSEIESPAVARIRRKARQLEAKGKNLIYLLRGEPDFDTPDFIRLAAWEALKRGHTHYGPTEGIPELRRAIAARIFHDFGIELDLDKEILVTTGATMGLYAALLAVVNPGDEVILFDPIYDPYSAQIRMAGGIPRKVESQNTNGHFFVSIDSIKDVISPRTRAILLNNPWNPTGSVMTLEELAQLVELAEANNLIMISDEIYENIVFDGYQHHCLAAVSPQARNRTIVINSFSKTYAMTGWRLGYNFASPELTAAMLRISEQFSRSAATFIQYAGAAALNGSQEVVRVMNSAYAARRDLFTRSLADIKIAKPPEGTFFYFLDVRPFEKNSQWIAEYLLEHHGVVTIPGSAYGPAGEGYLRLSFAYGEETLRQGIDAISTALVEFI